MTRRHDIDALRALAIVSLILYHWGMLYVAGEDWGWHIKSSHLAEWLQAPMLFVNRWRMSLLFLLSGVAMSLLLARRTPGRVVADRSWRLLLPLAFGILVVVPIQPYAQGVANGAFEPGFLRFLGRYFGGYDWPEGAFDGWHAGFTWNHLWYLAYLWTYCLALVLLLPVLRSRAGARLQGRFTGLRGAALLVLPAIPLIASTQALQAHFEATGDLVNDWYRHSIYFTAFVYGYWMGVDRGIWDELARLRKRATAYALAVFAIYFALAELLPDSAPDWQVRVIWTLRNLYLWAALCAVLGWSRTLLDRPFRWLPWANESVYPWYVLHQSLTVALAFWLVPRQLPAPIEAGLVLAGTLAGCWLGTAVIRRVAWLRPLFGLRPRPARHGAEAGDLSPAGAA